MHVHNKDWMPRYPRRGATRPGTGHRRARLPRHLAERGEGIPEGRRPPSSRRRNQRRRLRCTLTRGSGTTPYASRPTIFPERFGEIHLEMQSRAATCPRPCRDAEAQHECVTRARRLEREGNYPAP